MMNDLFFLICQKERHFPLIPFLDPSKGTVVTYSVSIEINLCQTSLFQLLLLPSLLAFVFSCSVCTLHKSVPVNLLLKLPIR